MQFKPKTLVAAVALALGATSIAFAGPPTKILYTAGMSKYVLKQADGKAFYYGHPSFAQSHMALPASNHGCTASLCTWKLISSPEAAAIDLGIVGWGGVTASGVAGVPVQVDRVIGSAYQNTSSDAYGVIWFLSGGRVKAIQKGFTAAASSFAPIIPTADQTPHDIAAINSIGQITDALVVVSGKDAAGIFFVTSAGDLYYFGKKPTTIKVGPDVIANDAAAATQPVLLRGGVSRIFASHNGNSSEGYKLAFVTTSGDAYVYSAAADVAPVNISSSLAIGKVTSVDTFSNGGGGVDTVIGAETGVYAEIKGGSSQNILTATGFNGTGAAAKLHQVPGITTANIAGGIQFGGSGNAMKTVLYLENGALMGFGGGTTTNPVGGALGTASGATLTPIRIPLTDPGWKGSLTATKDTVANKVQLALTAPANAAQLQLFRASDASVPGQLIAELPGDATSYTDTPPDGNLYYYYIAGVDSDERVGPNSPTVEGRANVAPTQVSGSAAVTNSGTVTITPTIVDPNAGDTFTLEVFAAPQNGTATIKNGNQIEYKSTNPQFTGEDTFKLRVTDQLGNSAVGNITVSVACAAPTLLGQSQDSIVEWGSGVIRIDYQAQNCQANLTAKLELLDPISGEPVFAEDTQMLAGAASQTLNFVVKDLPAKSYPARITFNSGTMTAQTLPTGVAAKVTPVTPPVLSVAKTTWGEDEKAVLTLTMPSDSNCPLTTDEATAQSNLAYCFAEATTIPLGLAPETVPGQLKVSGYGMPRTNTPFVYQVSKWDSKGQKHVVKQDLTTLSFLEAPAPTFEIFSAGTNVVAIRDLVSTELRQTSGAPCTVYPTQVAAQEAVAAGKRACVATFTPPEGAIFKFDSGANTFRGRFQAGQTGAKQFGYKIQRLYLDKPTLTVAEGSLVFNVGEFATAPTFAVNVNKDKVIRGIDTVQASVARASGEPCEQSTSADDVAASWFAAGAPKCLVTWGALPGGMTASGLVASGKITAPGEFSIPATVAFLNPSKGVEISASAEKSVTAALPQGPQFGFDATPAIPGTNIYAVGENGHVGKLTIGDDPLGLISLSIDTGAAAPEIHKQLKRGVTRNVTVTPVELWNKRTIVLTSLWEDFPDVSHTMTIQSVELPPAGMQAAMVLPKSIVSTMPVAVQVSLGLSSNTGLRYSEARMGRWMGYLGALQADGTITQLTEPALIEGGKATLTYPRAGDINNAQIVFVADVQSGAEGYSSRLVSKPAKISVTDGSAIVPIVRADLASGATPLRVKLKAEIQPEQAKNLRKTEWLISNDGGQTWAAVEKANGASINYIFKDKGKYLVKTMTTNKYSNEVGYSEPFEITAYELPQLVVDGVTIVRAGSTARLEITSEALHYKWVAEKTDGSKITRETPEFTIDSAMPQVIKVTAYASNETGEALNDPAAWISKKGEIRFINLTPVKVSITGAKTIEVGEEMDLTATIKTDWNNALAEFELAGRWDMPDGTSVPGMAVKWAPTSEDFAAQRAPTFTGWVSGFESVTKTSVSPKISVREYIWPEWKMEDRSTITQAPALIRLSVTADKNEMKQFSSARGRVKYTWAFPENVTGVRANGASATFTAEMPGDYEVQVILEDQRGNTTTLDYTVVVYEPREMDSDIKTTSSNKYNRAPLKVQIKPSFFKGHPKEKVTSYKFYRDGELLDENSKGRYIDLIEQPGEYNLSVEATTSLGRTFTTETRVAVADNQPPVCSLSKKEYKTTVTVTANCKDPDGKIVDYEWTVDGSPIPNKGYRVSVPMGSDIEVKATDDSGASVIVTGRT